MAAMTWNEWKLEFLPQTFECGDDYHECDGDGDGDGEHEHGTFLYFYENGGPDLEDLGDAIAARRVWSVFSDGSATEGRHAAASYLLLTDKPAAPATNYEIRG